MTYNSLIKKLLEKCKLLFPEGYYHSASVELKITSHSYTKNTATCKYYVFLHAMGNEKTPMTKEDEGYKESMYLGINATSLKEILLKVNDEIDKVKKTEKIDLQ